MTLIEFNKAFKTEKSCRLHFKKFATEQVSFAESVIAKTINDYNTKNNIIASAADF